MATDLETLRIRLEADINDLKTGLAQAQSSIKGVDDSIKTADTGMQKFTGSLKTMAGTLGVAFAGTQLVSFAKDAVMAASNMAESVSKVNVVFGEGAEEVYKFGESAATNLGISNQAALEAAGTYGNLFQAFGLGQGQAQEMSTSLVQLAADMASFNNTSIDDAILALRSGLSGETEPLKRFGVALSEVRLKTEAMSMGLIKSTSDALTPAAKAQASYALIMKDTALAQGDYARTADGTANTMKSLKAKIDDAKVALGEALMPAFRAVLKILELLVPLLKKFGDFIKDNGKAIAIYSGIVLTLVGAWKAYRAALLLGKAAQDLFMISMTLLRGGTLASIASTNGLAASVLRLNAAMRANPIGLVVTALVLIGAAFVTAYKKSETFRNIVNKAIEGVLKVVAKLVEGFGKFMSLLGKVPGMGWAKGIADGAQKAADKINGIARAIALTDEAKRRFENEHSARAPKGGKTTVDKTIVDPNAAKEAAAKEKQRLKDIESNQKKLSKLYQDVEKVKKDAAEKTADAEKDLLKANANAQKRFKEQEANAYKRHAETIASAEKARDKAKTNAHEANTRELIKITQEYRERVERIEEQYSERKQSLEKQAKEKLATLEENYQKKVSDLRQKAAEKAADIIKKGAEKQADILEKSIDRLRSAFASGAGFSITDMFKKEGSAGGLLAQLKTQLTGVQNLQANAAKLASQGYSQTFIEQVVKAGPEVGNQMAEAIASASPEQTAELKALYANLEELSNKGLDALAATMNAGGNLATDELRKAYIQVTADVQEALAQVNTDLQDSLTEAAEDYAKNVAQVNKTLQEGLDEAKKTYEKALSEAAKARDEAITESITKLKEALAEADAAFQEAVDQANKDLAEALEQAQKDLLEALTANQETFEEKIAEIQKNMKEKLADLRTEILATLAALNKLGAKTEAKKGLSLIETVIPPEYKGGVRVTTSEDIANIGAKLGLDKSGVIDAAARSAVKSVGGTTNVTINGVNLADPQGTAQNIVTLIKYGQTVQVASTGLSGIEYTGINAYKAGITGMIAQ